MTSPFMERMAESAAKKKSPIVVAIDPTSQNQANPGEFAKALVRSVNESVCAIKLNFHVLLPLSAKEIWEINNLAHSFGLQAIADIKLNDIGKTNDIAITSLAQMGFDAVIANPFIGAAEFNALSETAHEMSLGVIALVYMSHPGASEGYGLQVTVGRRKIPMYRIFFDRATAAHADGIVIGANQTAILRELSINENHPPIYSPGVGAQGGDAEEALKAGASYLIVGRGIINAKDPSRAAQTIHAKIQKIKNRE